MQEFGGQRPVDLGGPLVAPQRRPDSGGTSREPSLTALRQEVGGDGSRRSHGHGTGPARGRITAVPAGEHGEEARRRSQGHGSPAATLGVVDRDGRIRIDVENYGIGRGAAILVARHG